jgi:pyrroline-5-carboxylate reductase
MASSMIGGLIAAGHPASAIRVSDPSADAISRLQEKCGIAACDSNAEAADGADVVILAVKPQVIGQVCRSLAGALKEHSPLIISIAAGITIGSLKRNLGDVPVVRCMPNTPALLGCGATGACASADVSETQRAHAELILSAMGEVAWVAREGDIDAVTALSGSGPAYFFLFMEAMQQAAEELGLDREAAGMLTRQTGLGAARMALEDEAGLAELRRRVTSPGGTTERAVRAFESAGLRATVRDAVRAAYDRSVELSQTLS